MDTVTYTALCQIYGVCGEKFKALANQTNYSASQISKNSRSVIIFLNEEYNQLKAKNNLNCYQKFPFENIFK